MPQILGGPNDDTKYYVLDMDSNSNIAIGGNSKDGSIITPGWANQVPIVIYISSNLDQQWGINIYNTPNGGQDAYNNAYVQMQTVWDLAINTPGTKIVCMCGDDNGKQMTLVTLSSYDGSLLSVHAFTNFKSTYAQGDITGPQISGKMLFTSNNLIYFGFSQSGNPDNWGLVIIDQTIQYQYPLLYQQSSSLGYVSTLIFGSNENDVYIGGAQTNTAGGQQWNSYTFVQNQQIAYTFGRGGQYWYNQLAYFKPASSAATLFIEIDNYQAIFFQSLSLAADESIAPSGNPNQFNYEGGGPGYSFVCYNMYAISSTQLVAYVVEPNVMLYPQVVFIDFSAKTFQSWYLETINCKTSNCLFGMIGYASFTNPGLTVGYFLGYGSKVGSSTTINKYFGWVTDMIGSCSAIGLTPVQNSVTSFTLAAPAYNEYTVALTDQSSMPWGYPNNFQSWVNQYYSYPLQYTSADTQLCGAFTQTAVALTPAILQDQYYYLNSPASTYTFASFTQTPSTCLDTTYQYYAQYKNGTTFPQPGLISFNGLTQTFTFYSISDSDVGQHQIQVTGFLPNRFSSVNVTFTLFVQMQCVPKVYPSFIGQNKGLTYFTAVDVDIHGNVGIGGYSSDPLVVVYQMNFQVPIVGYLAGGTSTYYFLQQINNLNSISNGIQNNEVKNVQINALANKMVVIINTNMAWYFVFSLPTGNLLAQAYDSTNSNNQLFQYNIGIDSNDILYTMMQTQSMMTLKPNYKQIPILLNSPSTQIQFTGSSLSFTYSFSFDNTEKYILLSGAQQQSMSNWYPQYVMINTQTVTPLWGIYSQNSHGQPQFQLPGATDYAKGPTSNLFVTICDSYQTNVGSMRVDLLSVDNSMNLLSTSSFTYVDNNAANNLITVLDLSLASTSIYYTMFINTWNSNLATFMTMNYTEGQIIYETIQMPEAASQTVVASAYITAPNQAYYVGTSINFAGCAFPNVVQTQGFIASFQENLMIPWTVRNVKYYSIEMEIESMTWTNSTMTEGSTKDWYYVTPSSAFTSTYAAINLLNNTGLTNTNASAICLPIYVQSLTPTTTGFSSLTLPNYYIGSGSQSISVTGYNMTGNATQYCYDVQYPGPLTLTAQNAPSLPSYVTFNQTAETLIYKTNNDSYVGVNTFVVKQYLGGNITTVVAVETVYQVTLVNCTPIPLSIPNQVILIGGSAVLQTYPVFNLTTGCPSPTYTSICNQSNFTSNYLLYQGIEIELIPLGTGSTQFVLFSSNYSFPQIGPFFQCYTIATVYPGVAAAAPVGVYVFNNCYNLTLSPLVTVANQTYIISSGLQNYTFSSWYLSTGYCGSFTYSAYVNGIPIPYTLPQGGYLNFSSTTQTISMITSNTILNGQSFKITINGQAGLFSANLSYTIFISNSSWQNNDCDYLTTGLSMSIPSPIREITNPGGIIPAGQSSSGNMVIFDFWVKVDPNVIQPNNSMSLFLLENSTGGQYLAIVYSKNAQGNIHYSLKDSSYQNGYNTTGEGFGVIVQTNPNQWDHIVWGFQYSANLSGFVNLNTFTQTSNIFVKPKAYYYESPVNLNYIPNDTGATNGYSNYIKFGEIKSWVISPSSFNQAWINRYSGISFKYTPAASIPSTAQGYFVTQPYSTGRSWSSLSSPMLNSSISIFPYFYFKWNTDCVGAQSLCSLGFAYTGNNTCQQCYPTCTECSIYSTNCAACKTGYILSNSTCLCPGGQYQGPSSCLNCTSPCSNCTNSTSCLSCVSNYGLVGTSCVQCTSSQYQNSSSMQCQNCNNGTANCKSCVTSPTTCTTCMPGFGFINATSSCVSCNSTQYLRMPDQTCQSCNASNTTNCKSCSGTATNCTSCISSSYGLLNNNCVPVPSWCPTSQYINMNVFNCTNCMTPCSSCLNSSACTFCVSPFNYVDDGSYSCTTNSSYCPPATFKDPHTRVCRKCPQSCLACNPTTFACISCVTGFLLTGTTCTEAPFQCADGYYYNTALMPAQCSQCSAGCETCATSSTCQKCLPNYFLNSVTGACGTDCTSLVSSYEDVAARTCLICQPNCLSCTNNNYTCNSCKTGFYLYNNNCVARCPILGYYQNAVTNTCDACSPACEFCINSISDCIKCVPGALMQNRLCSTGCAAQYYQDPSQQCYPCDPSCQVCEGSLNTQCSACVSSYFLFETTCTQTCPDSMFGDVANGLCQSCNYYCTTCNPLNQCLVCDAGYKVIPNDCQGNYFLRTSATFALNVPLNSDINPWASTQITIEVWFKADTIDLPNTQVIVGANPYKIRIKGGVSTVQIFYNNNINFCDSQSPLLSDTWYHFAFTVDSEAQILACYLDGVPQSIGSNPTILITTKINAPTEITFGGTKYPVLGEQNFVGLITEFRLWNVARSAFLLPSFMKNSFTSISNNLVAYWKLNEKNDGSIAYWTDSANGATLTYNPSTSANPSYTLASVMDMREIYLLLCPDGQYSNFNYQLGYYVCEPCNAGCKQCLNSTSSNCTDCYAPEKLMQATYTCSVVTGCPTGFYEDPSSGQCMPCYYACETCINSATNCPLCNSGFFRQYQGSSCVATCPSSMYGNYQTQSCFFNPSVTDMTPSDGTYFIYRDIVELTATYALNYNENIQTFSLGWTVIRVNGSIDISNDVVKAYFNTSLTKVHLDQNVLQPNQLYQFTFFLQGITKYYNGFYANMTAQFYIGTLPTPGTCVSSLILGYATVASFTFSANNWTDPLNITQYNFFFSMDGGNVFIPIASQDPTYNQVSMTFNSVYQNENVLIQCQVVDSKSFTNSLQTIISVLMKTGSDANNDLNQINIATSQTEAAVLTSQLQLNLIAKSIGDLNEQYQELFDPKVTLSQCSNSICNYQGSCHYISMHMKYVCGCSSEVGGVNCTFTNKTELQLLQNYTQQLAITYTTIQGRQFNLEYIKLASQYVDLMTDSTFGQVSSILNQLITDWDGVQDNSIVQDHINVLSSLMEYLYNQLNYNRTFGGMSMAQYNSTIDNIEYCMSIFYLIRQNTIQSLSQYNTNVQYTTKMIAFRQVLTNQQAIQTVSAANLTSKNSMTYVKVSVLNFENATVWMENQFIVEVSEYVLNPYIGGDPEGTAGNAFDVNFYNSSSYNQVSVQNLSNPLLIYYLGAQNLNVSTFQSTYMSLSPFVNSDKIQRNQMLNGSKLNCSYWNSTAWASDGCSLNSIDSFHIICQCNHLTSFGPQFQTPPQSQQSIISIASEFNTTTSDNSGPINLVDLQLPFNGTLEDYVNNIAELLQHKQPSLSDFFLRPGLYMVLLFWFFYTTSQVYYSGRDRNRRYAMPKKQNRNDLAEIEDDEIQCLHEVIKGLIIRDFALEQAEIVEEGKDGSPDSNSKTPIHSELEHDDASVLVKLQKQLERLQNQGVGESQSSITEHIKKMPIYEEMESHQQKQYRQRARRKVFGRVGGLCERARRFYKKTFKRDKTTSKTKMVFFYEELKHNFWFGLLAKTSKIAPRHARLTVMYFNVALQMLITTLFYMMGWQNFLFQGSSTFQNLFLSIISTWGIWIVTIPMALLFRMPHSIRKQVEGVMTKKVNKVFKELDNQMGWRYAVGYFFCLTTFCLMSLVVLFFSYVYPQSYCMSWLMCLLLLYFLDLAIFTIGIAAFQLLNALISLKMKCWENVWAAVEVLRYVKNLRG